MGGMKKRFLETERGQKVLKFVIYGVGAFFLIGLYAGGVAEFGALGHFMFFGLLGFFIWAIWGDDLSG